MPDSLDLSSVSEVYHDLGLVFSKFHTGSLVSNAFQSVSFLGYIIGQGEARMDPSKVSAVVAWPTPSTCKQLQGFMGVANFYQRFI